MKLPCAVVRDLLPLHAEGMTEPETRRLMEEHLRECPDCRERLAGMAEKETAAVDTSAPLQALKREIRKRRWQAALLAALLVLTAAVTCFYHAYVLKPLPWQEGLVEAAGVRTMTDGELYNRTVRIRSGEADVLGPGKDALVLRTDSRILGMETEIIEEEDGTVTVILQGFGRGTSFAQDVAPQTGETMVYPVPDRLIYGYREGQRLLWGEPLSGGVEVLPRLALGYYALLAAALAALTGLSWFLLRHRPWSWILRQSFFAPAAYLLAHLLLKGLQPASFFLVRDLGCILLTAAMLYALLTLLWQVWRRRGEGAAQKHGRREAA